jgi:3-phosphoshikimate 1-carboxyvinyltransferase
MSDRPAYPETTQIQPLEKPPNAEVRVPGSKSITNRALILAALCGGYFKPVLNGCLISDDTEVMIAALRQLGHECDIELRSESDALISVASGVGRVLAPSADLFVGNSGTTMRFLTAFVSLGNGRYRLDGVPRMRERPIGDLLGALQQLGVDARSEQNNGCPPVVIESRGLRGGQVRIKGDVSSQFLSGLLMVCPFADADTTIEVDGVLVSEPYVDMTVRMMRQWDLRVEMPSPGRFEVRGRQKPDVEKTLKTVLTDEVLHTPVYVIEPDASAASYFFASAAITSGLVTVRELHANALQGDVRFVEALAKMGCRVSHGREGISVEGGPLRGIDIDMNAISDTVMTLAAVACFAEGPTTIRNVAHIRHKETDRIAALATELRKLGVRIDEVPDGLKITPAPLHGAVIDTYNDHRMAMSLALVGLKVPGVVIRNPGCVAKTYPDFFRDLEKLR